MADKIGLYGCMPTFMRIAFFLLAITMSAFAQANEVEPLKDDLFSYAPLIETGSDGAFRRFQYDELRDVNGRDTVPGRTAKSRYVIRVRGGHKQLADSDGGINVRYYASGVSAAKATFVLAYIHGNGGNRKQGINNKSFGGNFGRLQALVRRTGGRYLSPGFNDFGAMGQKQIAIMLRSHRRANPRAPHILACGSQGSLLCWRLVSDPETAPLVDGLVLLGGIGSSDYLAALKRGNARTIPVMFAHGSRDPIFKWQDVRSYMDGLRNRGVPARMDLFDGGIHGTPIRMLDWRDTLNWMLPISRRVKGS
jgi:predicted esterase